MSMVRTALVLVVLALFHPGIALLTVGVGTLVVALRFVVDWSVADEGMVAATAAEVQADRGPRPRN